MNSPAARFRRFLYARRSAFAFALFYATWGAGFAGSRDGRSVVVKPGDDLAAMVNHYPSGTTFAIRPGTYRLQSVRPKSGDSFVGEPGATLNGAQVLGAFSRSGRLWEVPAKAVRQTSYRGTCEDKRSACKYPEDLFMDDTPLERVGEVQAIGPGKWYLDYSTGRAFLADNPGGHRMELSVTPTAFSGDASNVRISGLSIEKYACLAGDGAVDGTAGRDWLVENNLIRHNHGMGVRLGDGMQVIGNKLIENGQLGVGGGGSNGRVKANEIAFNNYAGYDYSWEAGGSKFAFTRNLVVGDNFAHDNKGPGLWTDIDNENTLYEHNHTKSNKEAGIMHEISYRAVIRDNLIEDDGFSGSGKTEPWFGAGILIVASDGVEVYGNTLKDCMNGIVGTQARRGVSSRRGTPYLLRNLSVHDNTISQQQGIAAGIVRSAAFGDAVFDSWNNRFEHNHFRLADPEAKYFAWAGTALSYQQWTMSLKRH